MLEILKIFIIANINSHMSIPIRFAKIEEAIQFFGIQDKIKSGFFYEPDLSDQALVVTVKSEYHEPSRIYKIPKDIWIVETNVYRSETYRWYFCIYKWMIKRFHSEIYEPLTDPLHLLAELKDYADGFAIWAYGKTSPKYIPKLKEKSIDFPDYAMDEDISIMEMSAHPVKKSQFNENEYYTKYSWKPLCRDILCFTQAPSKSLVDIVVMRNGMMLSVEKKEKYDYVILKEV